MPPIPNEFPELQQLTEAQLNRLLNDDVAFEAHVDRLAKVDTMIRSRDELRSRNKAVCEDHISMVIHNRHRFELISIIPKEPRCRAFDGRSSRATANAAIDAYRGSSE